MAYTLRGKIANITPLTLDKTLTLEGASADAKAVGDAIKEAKSAVAKQTQDHADDKTNPHKVTAEQIGLGNCDNTSDMGKPVSFAQSYAIAEAKKAGTDAQTAAENAQTAADNAQTTADNAQTAADNANTRAENAEQNAKDYADSLHQPFTVSLPVTGWSETAPYTQTVTVEGILETDRPHWGLVYSSDVPTTQEEGEGEEGETLHDHNIAEKEAYAMVDRLTTADGTVTFTCLEDKPEVDLTIQMEVNR